MDPKQWVQYRKRIQSNILKAIRETKAHTSWVSSNTAHEESIARFIDAILDPKVSSGFLTDFVAVNRMIALCGMYNFLSQTVLTIFSPEVCDIYQGNEWWDFSLVDPDNRRSVDLVHRARLLKSLKRQIGKDKNLKRLAEKLVKTMSDGWIKRYVTWRALNYRRDHVLLFNEGTYIPLEAYGPKKEHICAFAWKLETQSTVVVVPRLVAELTGSGVVRPASSIAWEDTSLILPKELGPGRYTNMFSTTGKLYNNLSIDCTRLNLGYFAL